MRPRLRPHQVSGRDETRLQLRTNQAVLLVACTGYGKTIVAADIVKTADEKGRQVLFLAHRDTLIKQTWRKLQECGVDPGIIMAAFTPSPRKRVQLASVQTLVRRLERVKHEFDLIIIDEAHLSAAKSYKAILARWPKAKVIGLTGSPCRLDGKGLGRHAGGSFDVMVESANTGDLVREAYLVEPVVFAPADRIDLSGVKKVGGDYDSEQLAAVMDKPKITGSAIEAWQKHCPGMPAVAWCANVSHAKHVAEEFNAAGISAVALSGEDDAAEREKALAALASGQVKVITFAMLLVEGVDCPAIGAVIMLRPTMSLSSYLQVIGRGLRAVYADGMPLDTVEQRLAAMDAGSKGRRCYVLDHAGLTFKHGFADEPREWSLEGLVKKKGAKKKAEETIDLKQCPKCYRVHAPADDICPHCGHVYEVKERKIEHEDGELKQITPEMRKAMQRDRTIEVAKAKTMDELEAIGRARGYSEGWARNIFDARKKKAGSFKKSSVGFRPAPPIEVYEQDLFRR